MSHSSRLSRSSKISNCARRFAVGAGLSVTTFESLIFILRWLQIDDPANKSEEKRALIDRFSPAERGEGLIRMSQPREAQCSRQRVKSFPMPPLFNTTPNSTTPTPSKLSKVAGSSGASMVVTPMSPLLSNHWRAQDGNWSTDVNPEVLVIVNETEVPDAVTTYWMPDTPNVPEAIGSLEPTPVMLGTTLNPLAWSVNPVGMFIVQLMLPPLRAKVKVPVSPPVDAEARSAAADDTEFPVGAVIEKVYVASSANACGASTIRNSKALATDIATTQNVPPLAPLRATAGC